jgi:hypothetical protein
MSNDKAQMSNQIQSSNVKIFQNLNFDIHLTFACLREAPPAKALCGGQALWRRQGF